MASTLIATNFVRSLETVGMDDVALVGGKNASLGEMVRELTSQGVNVPRGFAITADGYWHFLKSTGLDQQIHTILSDLNARDVENLRHRGSEVRHAMLATDLPSDLSQEILAAYEDLSRSGSGPLDVAVRSSATAEDLPDASFAGQQETFSERPRRRATAGCLPPLFRLAVHRPGHLVPG